MPQLDIQVAAAKTAKYATSESGDTLEIVERPRGGLSLVLADGQRSGKAAKAISNIVARKAIALLALEHDAPIAVCYARRLDRPMHFEMVVSDMIDPRDTDGQLATVKDLTQWYTHKLEEAIRENPEQYWWVHRRWKDTRKKKRKPAAKAAA